MSLADGISALATRIAGELAAKKDRQYLTIGGLWYFTTGQWVTYDDQRGPMSDIQNTDAGTGSDPTLAWFHLGHIVPAGTKVSRFMLGGRMNVNEITGLDVRLYHIGATDSGTSWTNAAGDEHALVYTADNLPLGDTGIDLHEATIDFTTDRVGMLLLYMRAVGTVTGTRYLYPAGMVEIGLP